MLFVWSVSDRVLISTHGALARQFARFATGPTLTIDDRRDRILVLVKVRPHVSAFLAAGFAQEPCFQIGVPEAMRPLVCADSPGVAALIVRAIDQDAAHASAGQSCPVAQTSAILPFGRHGSAGRLST
jgi:hypothetical protein